MDKEKFMWKKMVFQMMIWTIVTINFSSCVSTKINSSGKTTVLEGTWENGAFILSIKETNYLSLYNGEVYGAGQIIYDGKYFILASTHAWKDNDWIPFIETIKGECVVKGNVIIISNVEGRYVAFNGEWKKTENLNIIWESQETSGFEQL
jgi:hypothetical protein